MYMPNVTMPRSHTIMIARRLTKCPGRRFTSTTHTTADRQYTAMVDDVTKIVERDDPWVRNGEIRQSARAAVARMTRATACEYSSSTAGLLGKLVAAG
jgi:hypothetical protein